VTAGTLTIQAMIDRIVADLGGPIEPTVDTVKSGDTSQPVRGAVTTFMATVPVIRQAAQLGANVIFTHEPTFFNHTDEVAFLQHDPVYQAKRRLLEETGIVVFRLHDYPHGLAKASMLDSARGAVGDDPFRVGLLEVMGWQAYADPNAPSFCTIPPVTLTALVQQIKDRLQVETVRVTGDPGQLCKRVILLFGSPGIGFYVAALDRFAADAVITGECPEWETFAYAHDAAALGIERAIIAVGHEPSEEPGMERLTVWLRERFPDVAFTHVAAANPVTSY
jgi:putative NIF3 family GTP cyclohydrolase 1 type 2